MGCGSDVKENIEKASELIREAAAQGAQVILPPELFERPYFCQERRYEYYGYARTLEEDDAVIHMKKLAKELETVIPQKLQEVRDGLYEAALENRERRTYACKTLDEITEALEKNGDGFIKAMWCGNQECEDKLKEVVGVTSRCIPFNQEHLADTCVCCGKPATKMVYWGKAY